MIKFDITKIPFVNFGVSDSLDIREQFTIRILNLVSVCSVISLVATAYFFGHGWHDVHIVVHNLAVTVTVMASLYLCFKQKFLSAKLLILVLIPVFQLFLCSYIEVDLSGIMIPLFLLCCFASVAYKNIYIGFANSFLILTIILVGLNLDGFSLNPSLRFNIIFLSVAVWLGIFFFVLNINQWAGELTSRNKKLKLQNQELKKLVSQNETKTQLLAILSHDLKGPVYAFDKLADKVSYLLKKEDYDQLTQLADYYEASGKKLFTNIERLLNWAMSQKQSIRIVKTKFKLYDLLQEIHENLQHLIREKNLTLKYHVARETILYTDQEILFIILKNLVENAVKYSTDGKDIVILYENTNQSDTIEISNTGSGIKSEMIENMHQGKFNRNSDGFGLGLSICFSLIKTLKGNLDINSIDGEFTKVIVSLHVNDKLNYATDRDRTTIKQELLT